MKKIYNVAIVDQKSNSGGGMRFARKLITSFSYYHQDLKIDYYGSKKSINNSDLNNINLNNVKINYLESLTFSELGIFSIKNSNKIIKQIQEKFKNQLDLFGFKFSGNLKLELEKKLKKYDVAIFVWPYLIDLPNIKTKKIIVLHDFMFKYYFGGAYSYNLSQIKKINFQMNQWVENSDVVVTSNFMKREFKKFYPNIKSKKLHLIRVGPFSDFKDKQNNMILKRNKISKDYILCPTNDKSHKNISNLLKAFFAVKKKFKKLNLVFCGSGTEMINGKNFGDKIQLKHQNKDVFGLGYVSDQDLDFLICEAKMVINQSFYESGNGSGLDAWFIGTPVVMSNISPFLEHLNYIKVKAEIFDPNKSDDIAYKIENILKLTKQERIKMITLSKKNIKKIEWKKIIKNYYKLIVN
jgi:glycosyltransferase involved in cell wall biosynthesis